MTLGQTIREAREAKGWTRTKLSRIAGVQRLTVARIERGLVKHPRGKTLLRLSGALGFEGAELMLLRRPKRTKRWRNHVDSDSIAGRIFAARAAKGLDAIVLARRAGISRTGLFKIEAGRCLPEMRTLLALADALEVDVVELLPKRRRTSCLTQ